MSMPEEPMGGVQNRNDAFTEGVSGAGAMAPSIPPSLLQRQANMNSGGPARVKYSGSSNGMSQSMYQGTMGGMFPTQNGSAADTYQTKKYFEPRS